MRLPEYELREILLTLKIEVIGIRQMENEYWPKEYKSVREDQPWWMVVTKHGVIEFCTRKKVIELRWELTKYRGILCDHDVTKSNTYIHAWGFFALREHVRLLWKQLEQAATLTAVAQQMANAEPSPPEIRGIASENLEELV